MSVNVSQKAQIAQILFYFCDFRDFCERLLFT